MKKLVVLVLLMSLIGYASAAVVVVGDSALLSFEDKGGTATSTLDLVTDIAGNPGVQYDITFGVPSSGTWADIALAKYSPTELAFGDTWEMTLKNVDSTWLNVKLYVQVNSGWNYHQGSSLNIAAGNEGTVSLYIDPAWVSDGGIKSIGIKVGTDSNWMNRPDGSPASIQVVPEPATLALLGLGGLVMRRKKR